MRRAFSSLAKTAASAPIAAYEPTIVANLPKGGLQNFGLHPNPKVQSLLEVSTQTGADGKYISWSDAGFTEKDWLDVLSYDKQCKAAGQTLQFGCTPEFKAKFEGELSNKYQSIQRAFDKSFAPKVQTMLAEDYLYLAGIIAPPKVPVTTVSFPLALIVAGGLGLVAGLAWMNYATRERHIMHTNANSWRLEGPDAPELRRP